ncbi:hypothetical protein H0H92_000338 [Tricholoma furcatifolium]|nr:hypothetical protein H0H92_000338 [Tricholoma furcatifolium]
MQEQFGKPEPPTTLPGRIEVDASVLLFVDFWFVIRDVSNPPEQITNTQGMIVLAIGNYLVGINSPLAQGFNILNGRQEVTIPADTPPRDDYSLFSVTLAITVRTSRFVHLEYRSLHALTAPHDLKITNIRYYTITTADTDT